MILDLLALLELKVSKDLQDQLVLHQTSQVKQTLLEETLLLELKLLVLL